MFSAPKSFGSYVLIRTGDFAAAAVAAAASAAEVLAAARKAAAAVAVDDFAVAVDDARAVAAAAVAPAVDSLSAVIVAPAATAVEAAAPSAAFLVVCHLLTLHLHALSVATRDDRVHDVAEDRSPADVNLRFLTGEIAAAAEDPYFAVESCFVAPSAAAVANETVVLALAAVLAAPATAAATAEYYLLCLEAAGTIAPLGCHSC